ncbi:MAG: ADP-forming succinate--CoA ligase subunit beta [Planctomycetes bacterium]|nr:ADP-forming succinate--CoA ligase subunit beta [Planctomycetota bacterium]
MLLHEYQSKELFRQYGIKVPLFKVVSDHAEVESAWTSLNSSKVVIKAQAHTGGRGKAGGIQMSGSVQEAREISKKLLGSRLITYQSGKDGKPISKLIFEVPAQIQKELYFACMVNRQTYGYSLIASTEGGVDIEEVSRKSPEKIKIENISGLCEFNDFRFRRLAKGLGLSTELQKQFVQVAKGVLKMFTGLDCSLIEINPLVVTEGGELVALDAKVSVDDRALWRHSAIAEMRDKLQEDPLELQANEAGLNYVSLDGNIGCMVNGAGLAMATMDIIKYYGGNPANFLDVGGGANKDQIVTAFKLLMANKSVRAILINIFGGILKCDVLAEGIVQAAKEVEIKIPIVVRLEGTNVQRGREILGSSTLKFVTASSMAEAAKKVVEVAR